MLMKKVKMSTHNKKGIHLQIKKDKLLIKIK